MGGLFGDYGDGGIGGLGLSRDWDDVLSLEGERGEEKKGWGKEGCMML